MAIEAHRCNVNGCKGFVLFENADLDVSHMSMNKKTGCFILDTPTCSECGKEFLVVPHYIVIDVEEHDKGHFKELESACITEWEKRERERRFKLEADPYKKIELFLKERSYTYSVSDIISEYISYREHNYYLSHSMKDCIKNLETEIQALI
ncbi:hypothetical protein NDS46_30120 (plasmid) [Paenibacillus thiaminolyticus]|uniref:hypothetical protein n=1 Tax=Paenibacillus thiaminolyticus TaxID=49283 RepID=UPI00233123DD|nr:hypothetical protein [Paenibacillus thiaminolyticus]WCF11604.1 hypothetical protein NDS46_30120 [Paenibacillus thiaminolyticus]